MQPEKKKGQVTYKNDLMTADIPTVPMRPRDGNILPSKCRGKITAIVESRVQSRTQS